LPAIQTLRWIRPTASPLFAGKPGSNKNRNPLWERCLPAIQTLR